MTFFNSISAIGILLGAFTAMGAGVCTPPTSDAEVRQAITKDMNRIYQDHIRSFLGDVYQVDGSLSVGRVEKGSNFYGVRTSGITLARAQFVAKDGKDVGYTEYFAGAEGSQFRRITLRLNSAGEVCVQSANDIGTDPEVCKGMQGEANFDDIVAGASNPNMDVRYFGAVKIHKTPQRIDVQKLAQLALAGDKSIIEWRYSYDRAPMITPFNYSPSFEYKSNDGQKIKTAFFSIENGEIYLTFDIAVASRSTAILKTCRENKSDNSPYVYMISYFAKAKVLADGSDLSILPSDIFIQKIQYTRPGYTMGGFDHVYP